MKLTSGDALDLLQNKMKEKSMLEIRSFMHFSMDSTEEKKLNSADLKKVTSEGKDKKHTSTSNHKKTPSITITSPPSGGIFQFKSILFIKNP